MFLYNIRSQLIGIFFFLLFSGLSLGFWLNSRDDLNIFEIILTLISGLILYAIVRGMRQNNEQLQQLRMVYPELGGNLKQLLQSVDYYNPYLKVGCHGHHLIIVLQNFRVLDLRQLASMEYSHSRVHYRRSGVWYHHEFIVKWKHQKGQSNYLFAETPASRFIFAVQSKIHLMKKDYSEDLEALSQHLREASPTLKVKF